MIGAGKNRGWFFIPEKNDEVLVMFEHGDINRPLVVGSLWNGKDKPPDKNPGGNPRRVIKSRLGSKITFDDDKEQLIYAKCSITRSGVIATLPRRRERHGRCCA
jgi:uncharacterized protein involved in type VI secretion and phage assembly